MITSIRPVVLALLAVLTATGILPPDVRAVIETHADAVVAGVLAAWAIVAAVRNRKAALAGRQP